MPNESLNPHCVWRQRLGPAARLDSPGKFLYRIFFDQWVTGTWTASVYTEHVTMLPLGSACVYIAHVLDRDHQHYLTMTKWWSD